MKIVGAQQRIKMNKIYKYVFSKFKDLAIGHMINTIMLGLFIFGLYKWMTYDLTTIKGGIASGLITGYFAARWSERYLKLLEEVKKERKNES